MRAFCALFWMLSVDSFGILKGVFGNDSNKHLELGKLYMAQGQLQDALTHFHAALEIDSNNYLTLFRRATVFLALGRSKSALDDLNKVIELKPDFNSARIQKGIILVKLGRLEEAEIELKKVLQRDKSNEEAEKWYSQLGILQRQYQQARILHSDKEWVTAADLLTKIIDSCPWDTNLREMRIDCHLAMGETAKAITDLRATTKLISDNTESYLKLSKLHYLMGEGNESLNEVRECLKLDPEHKECFPHYKKVKKVVKVVNDLNSAASDERFTDCISLANKLLKVEPSNQNFYFQAEEKLCHCSLKEGDVKEAISHCTKALSFRSEPRILCDRAEAFILEGSLDEAQSDYSKALEIDENFQRAKDGIQRVQKLQKQAKKRDYYKILNVRRSATKKEILKAYRKAAQKWHPDNFQGESPEKKAAEKKFIDIAAAKEVLTDPEKRKKFDAGEDPLDPESQQGQGFNPFQQHHGFHRGHGGGPFSFKFHFN
ncbi:dnaJ homolog subfamily C member 3-like [Artemia franciscana]